MRQRLAKLLQSLDRLSLRERLFVLAAGLAVLTGLWEALLAAPLAARERLAAEQVAALQTRLQQLDMELNAAAEGLSAGMPSQLERLRALRASVAAREEELRVFTTDLVDPAEMRVVLEELLRRQDGLRLISAVNLPARPVVETEERLDATASAVEKSSGAPKLYRHTLLLTLEGSYLDCLAYLEAAERLPWHIYWARLELAADEYPRNRIVLELRTLSFNEEWIGV